MEAMETMRAHSFNSNTPIARQATTPARISSENPPATPIPAIATEAGSPASLPVIPMTATKKRATARQSQDCGGEERQDCNDRYTEGASHVSACTFYREYFSCVESRVTPLLRWEASGVIPAVVQRKSA